MFGEEGVSLESRDKTKQWRMVEMAAREGKGRSDSPLPARQGDLSFFGVANQA